MTVTYGGTWAGGDEAFLTIGGTTIGKSVFPADTLSTVAAHFAYYINEVFVGVWAQASGGVLIIIIRSPAPAYSFSFSESHTSTNGTMTVSGSLTGGVIGNSMIDDTVTPVLNRAARDWHQNYFAELVANGMTCVAAFSQELVLPPDNPPSAVWVQRYPDGQPVETATGFGNKISSHCAFAPPFRDYIKKAYRRDGRPHGDRWSDRPAPAWRGALVVLRQQLWDGLLRHLHDQSLPDPVRPPAGHVPDPKR